MIPTYLIFVIHLSAIFILLYLNAYSISILYGRVYSFPNLNWELINLSDVQVERQAYWFNAGPMLVSLGQLEICSHNQRVWRWICKLHSSITKSLYKTFLIHLKHKAVKSTMIQLPWNFRSQPFQFTPAWLITNWMRLCF